MCNIVSDEAKIKGTNSWQWTASRSAVVPFQVGITNNEIDSVIVQKSCGIVGYISDKMSYFVPAHLIEERFSQKNIALDYVHVEEYVSSPNLEKLIEYCKYSNIAPLPLHCFMHQTKRQKACLFYSGILRKCERLKLEALPSSVDNIVTEETVLQ